MANILQKLMIWRRPKEPEAAPPLPDGGPNDEHRVETGETPDHEQTPQPGDRSDD